MKPDEKVKQWYGTAEHWNNSDHGYDNIIGSMRIEPLIQNKDVLNLGCFFPNIELIFAHRAKYWCSIDFTPEVIGWCKKDFPELLNYVFFLEMDMRQLILPDESFDVVLDLSSGDHLDLYDYQTTLDEIKRVLRKHGYFIVTYANLDHFNGEEETRGNYGYERRISSKDLKTILQQKEFKIIDENSNSIRSGLVCTI